jgi:hypothetical protein
MKNVSRGLLLLGALGLAACQDSSSPSDQITPPSFAVKKTPLTGTPTERAAQIAVKVNQRLAATGSKYRLSGASFFTTGRGVPPFRQLFRQAAELGDAALLPCSMAVDLLKLGKDELDPAFGPPTGLTRFLSDAAGAQVYTF